MSLSVWDAPNGSYTSAIPPGTQAFRRVVAEFFGYTRTEVIRDQSRCAHQGSEHCECGAIDFFTNDCAKARKLFDWARVRADVLGIQSVISCRRVVGFGNPTERHYDGQSPHTDHVHIGLKRWARRDLTEAKVRAYLPGGEEFDMDPVVFKKLLKEALEETVVPELKRLIIGKFSADEDAVKAAVGRGQSELDVAVNNRSYLKQIRDNTAEGVTDPTV